MVVPTDKKIAVNLSIPAPLMREFDALVEGMGKKEKWMVHSAALLMLLEMNAEMRRYYIQQAGIAEVAGGSFDELIDRAKAGALREEAARATARAQNRVGVTRAEPPPQSGGKSSPRPKGHPGATEQNHRDK